MITGNDKASLNQDRFRRASASLVEAMMPFQNFDDLPLSLRCHLPMHTQEIFRAAFNNAWAIYVASSLHEREKICHRIAWSAVKKRYRKPREYWVSI
jgi:cation transport regulator